VGDGGSEEAYRRERPFGDLAFAGGASAGIIPYPNIGTVNPDVYTFTATSTGEIDAFFVGSSADLEENIGFTSMAYP
jgi:hypothetical protein